MTPIGRNGGYFDKPGHFFVWYGMKVEIVTHDGKHIKLQSSNVESLIHIVEGINIDKSVNIPFAEVELVAEDASKMNLESLDVNELVHMIRLLSGKNS